MLSRPTYFRPVTKAVWGSLQLLCSILKLDADIGKEMWYDRIRLTFISKQMGQLAHINIPRKFLHWGVFGIATLIVCSLFMAASFFSQKVARIELESLRAESVELKEKYATLQAKLAEVETSYAALVEKENAIRAVFDLPAVDAGERRLGVGGPTGTLPSHWSETKQFAYKTSMQLDRLMKLAEYETNKFSEVEAAVLRKKMQLDRTPSIRPAVGYLSRGYGIKMDPFTGRHQMHNGLDIANRTGTSIVATANGIVSQAGYDGGHGKTVTIDHGNGIQTRYSHLSSIRVRIGQVVTRGAEIGLMGSTGYSTGPHLHYEVIKSGRPVDPLTYILN